jgi:hypothetical protein
MQGGPLTLELALSVFFLAQIPQRRLWVEKQNVAGISNDICNDAIIWPDSREVRCCSLGHTQLIARGVH